MLTIFVTNYWQLFTLRLLTGIALGGAPGALGQHSPCTDAPVLLVWLVSLAQVVFPQNSRQ